MTTAQAMARPEESCSPTTQASPRCGCSSPIKYAPCSSWAVPWCPSLRRTLECRILQRMWTGTKQHSGAATCACWNTCERQTTRATSWSTSAKHTPRKSPPSAWKSSHVVTRPSVKRSWQQRWCPCSMTSVLDDLKIFDLGPQDSRETVPALCLARCSASCTGSLDNGWP